MTKLKGFYISVEHNKEKYTGGENNESTNTHIHDYDLSIKKAFSETDYTTENDDGSHTLGYYSFDEASNTYTWVLQGIQGVNYQIIEKNYEKPAGSSDITRESTYRLINQRDKADEGGNYDAKCVYDESGQLKDEKKQGVVVRMRAYDDGTPYSDMQTVILHNSYAKPGVITVVKETR